MLNSPRLRKLHLYASPITGEDLPDDLNLLFLESLFVTQPNLSSLSLRKILASAPKLSRLNLQALEHYSPNLTDGLNLASLEQLTVERSKVSISSLAKFLNNTSNLNKLVLTNSTITGDDLPADLNLDSLQTLELYNCTISPELLKNIKAKAPHVKITSTDAEQQGNFPSSTSPARTGKEKKPLDANTKLDPNKKFNLTRIFYAPEGHENPAPNNHRLETFDGFAVNPDICSIDDAFTLSNKNPNLALEERSIPKSAINLKAKLGTFADTNKYYHGVQEVNLSTEWQSLASLSAEEELTEYHLNQAADVDIAYSKRDNLYYIRQKPGSSQIANPITIDFILKVPPASQEALPPDIQAKIQECLVFGDKAFESKRRCKRGRLLAALMAQKMGACRHRTLVFKAWMEQRNPPIRTRIIEMTATCLLKCFTKIAGLAVIWEGILHN